MHAVADADRLFAVPLEEFVEERKRLARELRAAGDKDAAAAVAKLPKPTPPAWALNLLAREEPDAVGDWLAAAEALRDASARPGKGLREAMAAHRDATRSLVALARDRAQPGGKRLSEAMLERVRALLQETTVEEERAEALRAGRITEGDDEALGAPRPLRTKEARAAKAADEEARAERRRAAEDRAAEQAEREEAKRVAELERRIGEAAAEVERLRESAVELERAAQAADERLAEAERTLARTESEAAAARDAASEAAAATSAAERDLRQLSRQLRSTN